MSNSEYIKEINRKQAFLRVPTALYGKGLKDNFELFTHDIKYIPKFSWVEVILYSVMLDKATGEVKCQITQGDLAMLVGCSRWTVVQAVKKFMYNGLIGEVSLPKSKKKRNSGQYYYTMNEIIPLKWRRMKGQQGTSWTPLPWKLIGDNPPVSFGASILYSRMLDRMEEDETLEISHKDLAEIMGCNVSSIKRYLNELRSAALIQSTGSCGGHGDGEPLYYIIKDIIPNFTNTKRGIKLKRRNKSNGYESAN